MRRVLIWVAVAATVVFCLFPFYWLINTSLKTGADLSSANLLPPSPTLDNYTSIFEDTAFTKALRNSAIIAGSVTVLSLVIGSFAGYALARLHLPFKFLILAILLSISTFPPIAIAAPLFEIWTDIGLYNTYLGLILPSLAFGLPLTVYILASFFRDIPRELEEAALIVPIGIWNCELPVKNAIAAETGRREGSLVSVIDSRNSFHAKMNASSPAVTRPGAASGSTTLRNAWKCVAPSTRAASSSSLGISLKNDVRM